MLLRKECASLEKRTTGIESLSYVPCCVRNLEMSVLALQLQAPSRILIVDDTPIARLGLMHLINQTLDLQVCVDTAELQQALQIAHTLQPDLAIVDTVLPGGSLLTMVSTFRQQVPALPLLVLTPHDERLYAIRALQAGARGYLPKHTDLPSLLDAIRMVLRGGMVVSDAMAARLQHRPGVTDGGLRRASLLASLSNREIEVLDYLGRGFNSREIAEQLYISVRTVETHRANLMRKLHIQRANELLLYAAYWHWDRGGHGPVES